MSFAPTGGGKGGGQKKGSRGRSTAAASDDTDEPAGRAGGAAKMKTSRQPRPSSQGRRAVARGDAVIRWR